MSDRDPSPWVLVLVVVYDDGTRNTKIIHRGPAEECRKLTALVPASQAEVSPELRHQLAITGQPPPEQIRLNGLPADKIVLGSFLAVLPERDID